MEKQRFDSVWDAIENTEAESASMKARSALMIALQEKISSLKLTQEKAAKKLAVTQPRLNDLLRGRINRFSLDALFDLATRANLHAYIQFRDVA